MIDQVSLKELSHGELPIIYSNVLFAITRCANYIQHKLNKSLTMDTELHKDGTTEIFYKVINHNELVTRTLNIHSAIKFYNEIH